MTRSILDLKPTDPTSTGLTNTGPTSTGLTNMDLTHMEAAARMIRNNQPDLVEQYPLGRIERFMLHMYKVLGDGVPPFYAKEAIKDLEHAKHLAEEVLLLQMLHTRPSDDIMYIVLVAARNALQDQLHIKPCWPNSFFAQLSIDCGDMIEICDCVTGVPVVYIQVGHEDDSMGRFIVSVYTQYTENTGIVVDEGEEVARFPTFGQAVACMLGMVSVFYSMNSQAHPD